MENPNESITLTKTALAALVADATRDALAGLAKSQAAEGRPLGELLRTRDELTPAEAESVRAEARRALGQGDMDAAFRAEMRYVDAYIDRKRK